MEERRDLGAEEEEIVYLPRLTAFGNNRTAGWRR